MKQGIEALGRIRLQGIVLLIVVFLTGVLAGAAGDRLVTRRDVSGREGPFRRPHSGMLPPPLERLDLTQAQREHIRDILHQGRPRTDSILQEALPRLRAITDSIRLEIRSVLTPEQREHLDREFPAGFRGAGFRPIRPESGGRPPGPRSSRTPVP